MKMVNPDELEDVNYIEVEAARVRMSPFLLMAAAFRSAQAGMMSLSLELQTKDFDENEVGDQLQDIIDNVSAEVSQLKQEALRTMALAAGKGADMNDYIVKFETRQTIRRLEKKS